MQRRIAAVLSADLVGFSRLVGQSEEATLRRLAEQRRDLINPLLEQYGGRVFKTMGDGLLMEFSSAVDAVRYALAQQQRVSQSEAEQAAAERFVWRIAIHLGDVVVDQDDLVGDGVNVVSRLQHLAPPGGVLISQTVRDQLPASFLVKAAGVQHLKNIPKPVRVFEVSGEGAPVLAVGRSVFAKVFPLGVTGVAVSALAAIAVGLWLGGAEFGLFGFDGRTPDSDAAGEVAAALPRVLVMPITTGAPGGREALLAEGLTDEIIGGLSKFSGIRVLGRNTSNALKAASLSAHELRERHSISYVVDSALRVLDDGFRLNFELIDARSGTTRWARRYEEDFEGAFAALDDVVGNIVSSVAAKVSRTELEVSRLRPPANLSAFELTLRGRELWRRPSRENLIDGRALLQQAIAADPNFAPPLAYLAFTHLTAYNNKWSDEYEDPSALSRMLELANRALELDPSYATAYAAQAIAFTYQGRHDEADAAAALAIDANPNDPDILGRAAQVLSFSGRHAEAITLLDRAIGLDPFGPAQWFNFLSRAQFFLGEYDPAIAAARTCLDRSKIQPCRETLAAALALAGQLDQAAEAWRQLAESDRAIVPEKLVARLRPAFRNQADLDRLVEGLAKAAAHAAQS